MLDYIPNDGYTETAYLKALPGIHGEFRFTFRPLTKEQRAPLLDYLTKPDRRGSHLAAMLAKKMSEHVKTWSLKDDKGEAVAVSEAAMLRLKPALMERLENIVMGLDSGDTAEESGGVTAEQLLEAELFGKSPGDVRTEADLKNSVPVSG